MGCLCEIKNRISRRARIQQLFAKEVSNQYKDTVNKEELLRDSIGSNSGSLQLAKATSGLFITIIKSKTPNQRQTESNHPVFTQNK